VWWCGTDHDSVHLHHPLVRQVQAGVWCVTSRRGRKGWWQAGGDPVQAAACVQCSVQAGGPNLCGGRREVRQCVQVCAGSGSRRVMCRVLGNPSVGERW